MLNKSYGLFFYQNNNIYKLCVIKLIYEPKLQIRQERQ